MTAPTDPLTLDVAFAGAPWVQVKTLGSTDVQTMDVVFAGAPFAFAPGDFITGTCTADTAACDASGAGSVTNPAAAGSTDLDAVAEVPRSDWGGWKKRAAALNPTPPPAPKPKKTPVRVRAPAPDEEIPALKPLPPLKPLGLPAEQPVKKKAAPRKARPRRIFGNATAATEACTANGAGTITFSGKATAMFRHRATAKGIGAITVPWTEEDRVNVDDDEVMTLIAMMESMEMEEV